MTRAARTPLAAAVLAFITVAVVGIVVATAVVMWTTAPGDRRRGTGFEHGVELGAGVGIAGAVCAAVAYVVQHRRIRG